MSEFSPVQLDALEDALEDLELSGIPAELEGDVAVVGRLDAYRDLLQLSRDALPMVDVRPGVLDGVLEAARSDAGASVVGAAVPAAEQADGTPWWKRWSVWIPALAVGASAALVLVMVRSTLSSDAEPAPTTVARADDARADPAAADEAAAPEPLLEKAQELQAVAAAEDAPADDGLRLDGLEARGRLRGSAAGGAIGNVEGAISADGSVEPEPSEEAEEEAKPSFGGQPEPTDKVIYEKGGKKSDSAAPAKKKSKSTAGPKGALPGGAAPTPAAKPKDTSPNKPAPKPEPKEQSKAEVGPQEAGKLLGTADASRRAGKCGSARSTYRSLLDHSDKRIRSRALAGLGLCALSSGDSKTAGGFFSRARKADPSIGSFIAAERDDEPAQQSL